MAGLIDRELPFKQVKKDELLHRVRDFMIRHRMWWSRALKWLQPFPAGRFSDVLHLELFKDELKISLHVAHLNHQFRGAESDEDARFVSSMAGRYGLPCTIRSGGC